MTQTMTRWQPFADLAELRSRFDRMFSELIDGEHGAWRPAIDVVEQPDQHRERHYGSFSRTVALPDSAKRKEIDATCHDGVLDITIPLAEASHETRTITPKPA